MSHTHTLPLHSTFNTVFLKLTCSLNFLPSPSASILYRLRAIFFELQKLDCCPGYSYWLRKQAGEIGHYSQLAQINLT